MVIEKERVKWWGAFNFSLNEIKKWQIEDRIVAIKRGQYEWTVWNRTSEREANFPIVTSSATEADLQGIDFSRHMVGRSNKTLTIEPSLADRAVVARPGKPFNLMPGQEVHLYVSTPLWLTILIHDIETPIADIPFWRPSDSWFGPSTMEGDLCYSKYTEAKTQHDLLEKRSHRATTLITIENKQEEVLIVDRINLPVPALKLYVNNKQEFWTDSVSISQEMENGKSVSQVIHSPPKDLGTKHQVSESRELSKKQSFLSSIKSLVG